VEDEDGATLAFGTDLEALKQQLRPRLQAKAAAAGRSLERSGATDWAFDTLPRSFEASQGMQVYPALSDEGTSVGVRLFPAEEEQHEAMLAGTRRLLQLTVAPSTRDFERVLPQDTKLTLARLPGTLEDCLAAAIDDLVVEHGGVAWDEAGFRALQQHVRYGLLARVEDVAETARRILLQASAVEHKLGAARIPAPARDDVRKQVSRLVRPGFVTATGAGRLPHVLRYLRAAERRLDKLPEDPLRDDELMGRVQSLEQAAGVLPAGRRVEIGWMLEELRVSLFAQQLGTAYRVSEKRVRREIEGG
jgi:ATP-dependent helicase HrpA